MNKDLTEIIHKAERKKAKLRLGLVGSSGSGKTYSSLLIAKGMKAKTLIVDTENGSANLYADIMEYDVLPMKPPYMPSKYIKAIEAAEEAGYDLVVLDSITHAWAGEGGLLDQKDKLDAAGGNTWANWRSITPKHNELIEAIVGSKIHVIATMRSKTQYVVNEKGQPTKVGLAPVQREGMDYEFTTVFDINQSDNVAHTSKDRTQMFTAPFKITEVTGEQLLNWLNTVDKPVE